MEQYSKLFTNQLSEFKERSKNSAVFAGQSLKSATGKTATILNEFVVPLSVTDLVLDHLGLAIKRCDFTSHTWMDRYERSCTCDVSQTVFPKVYQDYMEAYVSHSVDFSVRLLDAYLLLLTKWRWVVNSVDPIPSGAPVTQERGSSAQSEEEPSNPEDVDYLDRSLSVSTVSLNSKTETDSTALAEDGDIMPGKGRCKSVEFSRKMYFNTLRNWVQLSLAGQLPSFLKYHTCGLLASVLGNVLPEEPELCVKRRLGFMFESRAVNRKLVLRAKFRQTRSVSVKQFFELCEVKKSSLSIHELWVKKEVDSTFVALTTDQSNLIDEIDVGEVDYEHRVISKLSEVAYHLCKRYQKTTQKTVPEPYSLGDQVLPRTGCFSKGRAKGGNLGCQIEILKNNNSSEMLLCSWLSTMLEYRGKVVEVRGYGDPDISSTWSRYIVQKATEKVNCSLVGLPEPFKIRVISKGDMEPYALARSYQPLFWGLLRQSPVFDLAVGPLHEYHISRLIRGNVFGVGSQMISGDYAAATNNIRPDLSEFLLSEIQRHLPNHIPFEHAVILKSCLSRHTIHHDSKIMEQEWGQLMGSPISFPFLCLINYCLTISYIEMISGKKIYLPEQYSVDDSGVPCLVNGDDILFPLMKEDYAGWILWVSKGGLKPSPGKNYIHDRYCTVNSTLVELPMMWDYPPNPTIPSKGNRCNFDVTCVDDEFYFEKKVNVDHRVYNGRVGVKIIPHLKVHLMFPSERDNAILEDSFYRSDMSSRFRRLIQGQSDLDADVLISTALMLHKPFLKMIPRNISWFSSRVFGGWGLPTTRLGSISKPHLRLAGRALCSKELLPSFSLSSPDAFFIESFLAEDETRIGTSLGVDILTPEHAPGFYGPEIKVHLKQEYLFEFGTFEVSSVIESLKRWSQKLRPLLERAKNFSLTLPHTSTVCNRILPASCWDPSWKVQRLVARATHNF